MAQADEAVANTPVITKNWIAEDPSDFTNDMTFSFTVAYVSANKLGTNAIAAPTGDYPKTVTLSSKWADNKTTIDGKNVSSAQLTAKDVFGDSDFTAPGEYIFKVTENDESASHSGITYSTAVYYLFVEVAWKTSAADAASGTVIKQVVVGSAENRSDSTKADPVFENGAAPRNLTITKKVAGAASSANDIFTFTIKLDPIGKDPYGEGISYFYYDEIDSSGKVVKSNEGYIGYGSAYGDGSPTWELRIKAGYSVRIKNLPIGMKYTITEADTDYVESNTVNGAASENGLVATGTITKSNEVVFTNTKEYAPVTGIGSSALPLVGFGIVAAAGGAALAVSRRRARSRREEF